MVYSPSVESFFINSLTSALSPDISNSKRSRLLEIRISMDGDIVAWNAPMYFPISMTKQASTFSAGGKAVLHRRPLDEDRYNGKQIKPSVYMVR